MNLKSLDIEKLVELRTKMILEKKSTKEINEVIYLKEREYARSLVEDTSATGGPAGAVAGSNVGSGGVAMANAGIAGMGAVVGPQPSPLSGSTIGPAWSDHGGTLGSGDVSIPFPVGGKNFMYQKAPAREMGKSHGPRTGKKSRVKKLDLKALKNVFAKRQDFTAGSEKPVKSKKVLNFDDFQKNDLNKVTKVKEEYAFWNKESDIAEKILKNMDLIDSSDILVDRSKIHDIYTPSAGVIYSFKMKGFDISVTRNLPFMPPSPSIYEYEVKIDGVRLDVSWNQGRKIYNKAKKISELPKKEEEDFIKKDARISL
jgi:hypothetical protein